jgi:uncharacterized membrane protein
MGPEAARFAAAPGCAAAGSIVMGRCAMCHAAEPFWDGILWPPDGVMRDTGPRIAAHARAIYLQAGLSHAMPRGNLTGITEKERAILRAWVQGAG